MSDEETSLNVFINPLVYFEADKQWDHVMRGEPTPQSVLKYLCSHGVDSDESAIAERYREIADQPKALSIVPIEERILEKLVWPLRHAIGSYMVGNYLGTISLCGMASEMLAILLFDISDVSLNGLTMTEPQQHQLFGRSFEKLGQDQRVKVLRACSLIDTEIESAFNCIRTKRKRYLHFWSQDHDSLPKDAINCYKSALAITIFVIGQDISDGILQLNPELVRYLLRNKSASSAED